MRLTVLVAFLLALSVPVAAPATGRTLRMPVGPAEPQTRDLVLAPQVVDVRDLADPAATGCVRQALAESPGVSVGVRSEGLTNDDNQDGTVSPPNPNSRWGRGTSWGREQRGARVVAVRGRPKHVPPERLPPNRRSDWRPRPTDHLRHAQQPWIGVYAQGLEEGGPGGGDRFPHRQPIAELAHLRAAFAELP